MTPTNTYRKHLCDDDYGGSFVEIQKVKQSGQRHSALRAVSLEFLNSSASDCKPSRHAAVASGVRETRPAPPGPMENFPESPSARELIFIGGMQSAGPAALFQPQLTVGKYGMLLWVLIASQNHQQPSPTWASSRMMARKAYSPSQTRLLRAAPMRPVTAVTKANRPMPPNAKMNLRGRHQDRFDQNFFPTIIL